MEDAMKKFNKVNESLKKAEKEFEISNSFYSMVFCACPPFSSSGKIFIRENSNFLNLEIGRKYKATLIRESARMDFLLKEINRNRLRKAREEARIVLLHYLFSK